MGRNQQILELLRSAFGGNQESPHVYAPVHLQSYHYRWRSVRHRRVTTSAGEYFREFWYVGFPAAPAPNRRRLIRMFNSKYPNVAVNWGRLLRTRGAVRRQTYSIPFSFTETNEAPAGGSGRRARNLLIRLVRARIPESRRWSSIREASRNTGADGRISITFSYKKRNQTFTGANITGLLPRLRNQRNYRALLSLQNNLTQATRPLEEGSNLTANDFHWRLRRVRNRPARTYDYRFTGRRTVLRIQRDLVEPDPNRRGRTRHVRPISPKPVSSAEKFHRITDAYGPRPSTPYFYPMMTQIMSTQHHATAQSSTTDTVAFQSAHSSILQRQCACGNKRGLGGECGECRRKNMLNSPLQTKLRINQPGDRYEREADRMADTVTRMPAPLLPTPGRGRARRGCISQMKPLMRQQVNSAAGSPATAPPIVHDVLRSPGQSLNPATRRLHGIPFRP